MMEHDAQPTVCNFEEPADGIEAGDIPDQWLELEFRGRVIVENCSKVTDHTLRGDGKLVLTTEHTSVGIATFGGPTMYNGDLLDYLRDEHSLEIDGWKIDIDTDKLDGEPIDPAPDDVGSEHTRESADMAKIQRRWLRTEMLTTKLVLKPAELTL